MTVLAMKEITQRKGINEKSTQQLKVSKDQKTRQQQQLTHHKHLKDHSTFYG